MIEQVLRVVLPHLDRLGIPYLITGGIAATVHGRPRFTQDIDFVEHVWNRLLPNA